ncbi:MAG: TRL domain-containing protein [Thermodesulfobacteriota bacterium]
MKTHPGRTILVLGILLTCLGGCAYVNTKTPLDIDLDRTELGTKVGTAEAYSVLWLVAWGDAGYAAAARNGNITVMRHADQEIFQVALGLYTRWRVVVYGD